jgi:hypothetical protein
MLVDDDVDRFQPAETVEEIDETLKLGPQPTLSPSEVESVLRSPEKKHLKLKFIDETSK